MVLVDSSVWLAVLNSRVPEAFRARIQMEALLSRFLVNVTETVRYDVLKAINSDERSHFLSFFNQLPVRTIKDSTWNVAIQIAWDMQMKGVELEHKDAIVAALALQNQMPLFSLNPVHLEIASIRRMKLLS